MQRTSDINVVETRPLPSPATLLAEIPKTDSQAEFVTKARQDIHRLIFTDDRRLLLVVGPCSIHDVDAGREYAGRLAKLAAEVSDRVMIVMRVYFEKPRTTVGWKGLIMDPRLDGSNDIASGLRIARTFLRDVLDLGIPTATELLDPVTPRCRSGSRTGPTARCRPQSTRSGLRPTLRLSSGSTWTAPPRRSSPRETRTATSS
jgi:3-deoxy-7-phosphoheptulonate synthase